MRQVVRAAVVAAALCLTPAISALPSFAQAAPATLQDRSLDDAAIKLEATLKEEAGAQAAPLPALKLQAEDALKNRDYDGAARLYAQIVSTDPNDAKSWRRYADTLLRIEPAADENQYALFERATTAAYIAYRRAATKDDRADALVTLANAYGKREEWRPALNALSLALSVRETESLRTIYTRLREKYGFRVTNFSVDSDAASPRACFQFSEALPQRVDFSPYVSVTGMDKPALSLDDQQLCVDGLEHGKSYSVTLREGLPSTVDEALLKPAKFDIYVRDRAPFVRVSGKAYVLPKTGQQGIPLVSVNTDAVTVTLYRIGDRNLINAVLDGNFQNNLYPYSLNQIAETEGEEVWTGSLEVKKELNQDVTTNFPVTEAVPELEPGVYVLAAEPANQPDDEWGERATQWFIVSDLGLTAYSGADGIHAFVNSLASTEPLEGVKLRLLARNNEVLATTETDANGAAHFAAGLTRGEGGLSPAMLVASQKNADYGFLSLKQAPFDLTDRGVAGRTPPGALDAFVFAERGVYRTGETVHLTALLRDAVGEAVSDTPLTLVVTRPDGVEYRRAVVGDQGLGGRSLDLPIIAAAPTGTWQVAAYSDPKASPIGETTFLVEDYVPDRLEFDMTTDANALAVGAPAEIAVDGRYLYGAPAAGLALEGEMRLARAEERPGFKGYRFGPDDGEGMSQASAEVLPLEGLPKTDSNGKAVFPARIAKLPDTTHPLEASITVRMAEPGGRAVERDLTLPVRPQTPMIGVKPLFKGASLGDGATAEFDVAMVAPDGAETAAEGLTWELLQIETKYQWYRQDGYWQFEPVKITRRIANGTLNTAPGTPARISVPVSWGRYRLEVASPDSSGPLTTFGFDAGWYAEASADTPDFLEVGLDKSAYKPGDTMTVAVTARSAGKVTLSVIGDKLLTSKTADVEPGLSKIPLEVGEDWGTGAYVVATLRRPLEVEAKRMPGRAIGLKYFSIGKAAHTIGVSLDLPKKIRPETTLKVPVKLANLAPGEQARMVVAAVDVGILNLTNYQPPAPTEYYLGQRKLAAELRDLYGQLIDGMQGTKGAIRMGGDFGGAEITGSPPSQAPLALYSGIVTVGEDGTAEVEFDIPAFSGTVRVMAVAWNETQVGEADGDVIVRDSVVASASLPRFLAMGDTSTLRLDLDNVEGEAGDYVISASSEGPITLGAAEKTLELKAKQRRGVNFPLGAAGIGDGLVSISVKGPGGFALERHYALSVHPANQIASRRTVSALEPGASLSVSNDVFSDFLPGTGSLALSVTPTAALDVATLIASLDRYPLGCTEQVISRAMPLLYAKQLSAESHLTADTSLDERLGNTIETVLARQGSEGAFGLWSAGGADPWLDSYVTDFLTRARDQGYSVSDEAFTLALNRLRNYVSTAPDVSRDGGLALSYALYVLARNGTAPVGDLRYIADTKLSELGTPAAKAQIGAALAMLGDRIRAEKAFRAALSSLPTDPVLQPGGRADFGSPLRDAAAVVTLAAEGKAPNSILVKATARIAPARKLVERTSTQDDAWLVLAARALGEQKLALSVNGTESDKPVYRQMAAAEIAASPLKVSNNGETPVDAVLDVSGAPVAPEPAADHGFHIERSFHRLDGTPVDISKARQNQRFVVVLRVSEPKPQFARVALTDYIPAGFEIDNPNLVASGETGAFSWIADNTTPVHQSFRDDRFTAAFDRDKDSPSVFAVAYVVRAVSPGEYVLPQAHVEDMYARDRYGQTGTGKITVGTAK
ncbi:alpha-2-macroglobulin [Methyloligella sp. 2.7D]|uniref:alpha-2-macroglobulin family protein n=1 Tax=unclassified Methyloligella TaxID=2625955 RepID=UPI00157D8487|nr:alpha-2-macroglobulin [Methyloligella sp. GL2]QKP78598.1 alpha-2-macroglobulin family protein [Methyloligella sp. GL2]